MWYLFWGLQKTESPTLSGHSSLVLGTREQRGTDEFESDAQNAQELKKVKMWKAFIANNYHFTYVIIILCYISYLPNVAEGSILGST